MIAAPYVHTKRRSHDRFYHQGPGGRYSVAVWDIDTQEWEPWKPSPEGLSLMGLRAAIRELERLGYSSLWYAVDRENGGAN